MPLFDESGDDGRVIFWYETAAHSSCVSPAPVAT